MNSKKFKRQIQQSSKEDQIFPDRIVKANVDGRNTTTTFQNIDRFAVWKDDSANGVENSIDGDKIEIREYLHKVVIREVTLDTGATENPDKAYNDKLIDTCLYTTLLIFRHIYSGHFLG